MRGLSDSPVLAFDSLEVRREVRPQDRVLRRAHGQLQRHQVPVCLRTVPKGRHVRPTDR